MVSLLLSVFLVQLVIHLVNTLGSAAFSDWIWRLYNIIPSSTSSNYKAVVRLRRETVRLQHELAATSAQDEFAKWAKLQRQFDKTKAEHDKKAGEMQSFESTFKTAASLMRMMGTNGTRFLLQFWYGKVAIFWIPQGWMPGYVEWLLAFPKAPSGSISVQVWFMACASVIAIASEAVASIWALRVVEKEQDKKAPASKSDAARKKLHAQ